LYNPTSPSIRLPSLQCNLPTPIATLPSLSSRSLNPNSFPPRPQKAPIALLISPPSTETQANPRRPRPPLEKQNREYDTERETEGRSDQERGKTAIPLSKHISPTLPLCTHCSLSQLQLQNKTKAVNRCSIPSHSITLQKQALQVATPAQTEEQSTSQASFRLPIQSISLPSLPPHSSRKLN
jgi:hypothetical protein